MSSWFQGTKHCIRKGYASTCTEAMKFLASMGEVDRQSRDIFCEANLRIYQDAVVTFTTSTMHGDDRLSQSRDHARLLKQFLLGSVASAFAFDRLILVVDLSFLLSPPGHVL